VWQRFTLYHVPQFQISEVAALFDVVTTPYGDGLIADSYPSNVIKRAR
jgi:hypothetical protein